MKMIFKDQHESIEKIESCYKHWEQALIIELVRKLDVLIEAKQSHLEKEENFAIACEINSKIHKLASLQNDLHIWSHDR